MHKLDKELRSEILSQYRSISKAPCFLQNLYGLYHKRFRRLPVIVQLSPMRGEEEKKQVHSLLYRQGRKTETLNIINGLSTNLTIGDIKNITQFPSVAKVYLDREVRALLDTAIPSVGANRVWDRGYTGKGVTIAVLDSGVYPHPDFLQPINRILAFQDFTSKSGGSVYDDNGHGTHCAGAALGNGYISSGKYRGPAFQANLVALKILNKMGSGKASSAIRGLEWCLTNRKKFNIRIISLSLGYKASESYRDDPVCQAIDILWKAGIFVCAAAGNDGPEDKTINAPGIHPAIITVGASDDKKSLALSDDVVADFSSRGPTVDGLPKPDLLAPGANIVSTRAKGSFLDIISRDKPENSWYINLSGTSMATPICAGIAAQMLEAHPHLSPDELKNSLLKGCVKLGSVDANNQGSGCINAARALSAFMNEDKKRAP